MDKDPWKQACSKAVEPLRSLHRAFVILSFAGHVQDPRFKYVSVYVGAILNQITDRFGVSVQYSNRLVGLVPLESPPALYYSYLNLCRLIHSRPRR